MNRRFFNKNSATDVITFADKAVDIVISIDRAQRQARSRGLKPMEEVALLMCHGLLHASGMDDQTEAGWLAMRQAEFASLARAL